MMRRYESQWQRFAQPDPYDGSYDLTDPQTLNRYAYVQNDPVNLVDPSGLEDKIDIGEAGVVTIMAERDIISDSPDFYFESWGRFLDAMMRQQAAPKLKNATLGQQGRFEAVFDEMWKRLHQNDGKNPCADLLGGVKKAEAALKATKFSIGNTKNPNAGAQTQGKNVTIPSSSGFFDTSGSQTIQVGANFAEQKGYYVSLDNIQMGAFYLLHELGHRTNTLDADGDSPLGLMSVINNGKVRKACFGEASLTEGPLMQ